ncbi:MAG TPA: hypothetical protein VJP80_07830 [Candidatus Saccharimonadales bacterium]|nr:hypothetical protein [Candidatus Saccharimonadales bacterium]
MFGQQDDSVSTVASDMSQPAPGGMAPAEPASVVAPAQPGDDPNNFVGTQSAAAPVAAPMPAADNQAATAPIASDMSTPQPDAPASPAASDNDDLLDIKQQALSQLSPLVGHLDQSPEEKFRTTMMMIQASDNSSLIKDAYEAAQQIGDEKVRAQALLDIINEINYFTQHQEQ